MKKILTFSFLLLSSVILMAQGTNLGANATLWVGGEASFSFGGNTTLNGVITNNGEIISYSDLDFVANRDAGSLRFLGMGDQNLSGDTLDVMDIVVMKTGDSKVVLLTDQVVVSGELNVESGVIQADDELDLVVQGSSTDGGNGFVEGKLVGLTSTSSDQKVTFPMGLNGFTNYLTLTTVGTSSSSTIVRVECQVPDPTILNPEEEIQEISDEVEWVLTTLDGGSVDVKFRIDFSGVDLSGTTYGESILADKYEAALLALVPGDSLFRVLAYEPVLEDPSVVGIPESGGIISSSTVTLSDQPVRLTVGLIPVVADGVIEFFVPKVFAPNAIFEQNRIFRPFFLGEKVTDLSMTVYNNLNAEVYSISLSDTELGIDLSLLGWDGRLPSTGQLAPAGVYYYNINLTHGDDPGVLKKKAGTVLLVE